MTTAAVDTNIILDILIPDEPFSTSSKRLLDHYLAMGKLIICETVFAELASGFHSEQELKSFLSDTGIRLVHSAERALYLAGSRWTKYAREESRKQLACSRCGNKFEARCPKCQTVIARRHQLLSDFLIGAHALTHADCILTRDLGIYKTYFKELNIIGSR